MDKIEIREASISEAFEIHKTIEEFEKLTKIQHFEERYGDKIKLVIVAYINGKAAGYMVGYDKYEDGSFYCWMTGVNKNYRKKGILTMMMGYFVEWSKSNGYNKIRIKTRNNRRGMLNYLVKNSYNLSGIKKHEKIEDHRLSFEKEI